MRRILLCLSLWAACLPCCTHPKQPNAMRAQQSGLLEYRAVVNELARIAEDEAVKVANFEPERHTATDNLRATLDKIWTNVRQSEVAEGALQISTEFIASQRGVWDIWRDDWRAAKAKVAASQPAK